jgi:hypothetical protein
MREVRRDKALETSDEVMRRLWRQVELEEFDGDEPFALRVVAAKDGSESSSTNLMKHAKRAERIGRRTAGLFRVQR